MSNGPNDPSPRHGDGPPLQEPASSVKFARLWVGLGVVIAASFAVLGYFGRELYRQAPPVPDRVVTSDGRVLFTGQDIKDGQNVWQSIGGQELGSVWGHGAYVAPDWLHREATWLLDSWAAADHGKAFDQLSDDDQAVPSGPSTGWSVTKDWDVALGHHLPATARQQTGAVH